MQAPFRLASGDLVLSASIGVALCPGDAEDAATLVQYADIALHQAKHDGSGNCRFFTDVSKIIQDLKDFSHVESEQKWEHADLRVGLKSTLNIIASELRQVADIVTDYGPMSEVECLPSQLNQVFMNLIVAVLRHRAETQRQDRGRVGAGTGRHIPCDAARQPDRAGG